MTPDIAVTVITIESVQEACSVRTPQKQGAKCDGEKTIVINGVPATASELREQIRILEEQLRKAQNRSEPVRKN